MEILANIIVLIHVFVILLIIVGTGLIIFGRLNKNQEYAYLALISGTALSFIVFQGCVLTIWEKALREKNYETGFVSHYLLKLGITVKDIWVVWTAVFLITVGSFAYFYREKSKKGNKKNVCI